MKGQRIFELIGDVDGDLLSEALPPSWQDAVGKSATAAKPRRHPLRALGNIMNTGLGAAVISGIVAIGVLAAIVLVGQNPPAGPQESESDTMMESILRPENDPAPNAGLQLHVSSGREYFIPSEIILEGTFYEPDNPSKWETWDASDPLPAPPETVEYPCGQKPGAEDLRAMANELQANAVRTIFAKDTLTSGIASSCIPHRFTVYSEQFETLMEVDCSEREHADRLRELTELPIGTYYIVMEGFSRTGEVIIPPDMMGSYPWAETDRFSYNDVRMAYTFALIKEDFFADYIGKSPELIIFSPHDESIQKRITSDLVYRAVITAEDEDGKTLEYRASYEEAYDVLAMDALFRQNTIHLPLDMNWEMELVGWNGLKIYGKNASLYFDMNGNRVNTPTEPTFYAVYEFYVKGGTHTVGDTTYTVDTIVYQFPVFVTQDLDYADRIPVIHVGAGEDVLFPMNERMEKSFTPDLLREMAEKALPAYAEHLQKHRVTVSADVPLTVTRVDTDTWLREMCVYDANFTEVASGSDPSCTTGLPVGDYYAAVAVGAEGRYWDGSKLVFQIYYFALRVTETGGGIVQSDSSAQVLVLNTDYVYENHGNYYHLSDSLRNNTFDANQKPDTEHPIFTPDILSPELRAIADRTADNPVTLTLDTLYFVKPLNEEYIRRFAVYDMNGHLIDSREGVLMCLSDWEGSFGETQVCCGLPAGEYVMVVTMVYPDSPGDAGHAAYDYAFRFVRK